MNESFCLFFVCRNQKLGAFSLFFPVIHPDIEGSVAFFGLLLSQVTFSGIGIGAVFGCLIIGYARNPSLKQQLFSYAILGFALSEAMGLFCLMIAFLMLFGL